MTAARCVSAAPTLAWSPRRPPSRQPSAPPVDALAWWWPLSLLSDPPTACPSPPRASHPPTLAYGRPLPIAARWIRAAADGGRGGIDYGSTVAAAARSSARASSPPSPSSSSPPARSSPSPARTIFQVCPRHARRRPEKRWRDLADGDKSGKDGHAGEPTVTGDACGRRHALERGSQAQGRRAGCVAVWSFHGGPPILPAQGRRPPRVAPRRADPRSARRREHHHPAAREEPRLVPGPHHLPQSRGDFTLPADREATHQRRAPRRISTSTGATACTASAAAAAYYGKTPAQLDVGEAAPLCRAVTRAGGAHPYANPAGARRVRSVAPRASAATRRLAGEKFTDAPLPASLAPRRRTSSDRRV